MRRNHLNEILRDADIASAIQPLVAQRHLSRDEVREALITLKVPRAVHVATLVVVE